MRQFLINKLKQLTVTDELKLIEYVDFCLRNKGNCKIKHKTNLHHILPKADNLPFLEFKDLKEFDWNGVHLLHKDHLIAHSLLAEAINHDSIINAWQRLNNGKYDIHDAISLEIYQKLKEMYSTCLSARLKGVPRTSKDKEKCRIGQANMTPEAKMLKQQRRRKTEQNKDPLVKAEETAKRVKSMTGQKRTQEQKECMRQGQLGYKQTEEHISKKAASNKGKPRSEETKMKLSEKFKDRPILVCPHCNKEGRGGAMIQWHFNNCRNKGELS